MDSEDDMYDLSDPELLDDDDGDEQYDESEPGDCEDDDRDDHQEQSYMILSEADIRQRQEDDINQVSTTLSLSRFSSCTLLFHYNWNVGGVFDDWFADEEKVRKAVGLTEEPIETPDAHELTCTICFETCPLSSMSAAACGHHYCSACWRGYIGTSINDGPGCLMLRCPQPSCHAAVGQDMVDILATGEDKAKYSRYLLRSYIEDNKKKFKWCPSPGCEFAAYLMVGNDSTDVRCNCSYSFCWNCAVESHRPVDCETVAKWLLKNSAEAENTNWILSNSKACPKCRWPIEKNQGCMHMTCRAPCRYEFCWLCLGSWKEHLEKAGGFYNCNRYEAEKKGGCDDPERIREMAKNSLERYTHYYERWASNHKSRQKALEDLHSLQAGKIDELRAKQGELEGQMKFIIEAWLQIVDCRRVLKWTYAYGYYLHDSAKREFFEYLQGEAELGLERLHHCAEKDLQVHLDAETPTPANEFRDFRQKLSMLTSVTRTYFVNLVEALATGLQDVSEGASACIKKDSIRPKDVKGKKRKGAGSNSRSPVDS